MFGRVEDLLGRVHPASRLHRGLAVLQAYCTGCRPDWTEFLAGLKPGEKREVAIEGDILYAILQCYAPKPRAEGRFEAHARHTDLQYLAEGTEWIEVCDLRAQTERPPFDEKGNVFFPLGPDTHSRVRLGAGQVAVLFPNDAHAPCLRVEDAADTLVRKIVIKVRDAEVLDAAPPSH
jgi:YhcH/YjgK/YiaL family protein